MTPAPLPVITPKPSAPPKPSTPNKQAKTSSSAASDKKKAGLMRAKVRRFLRTHGLNAVWPMLHENGFSTMTDLSDVTADDLADMEFDADATEKLLAALAEQ